MKYLKKFNEEIENSSETENYMVFKNLNTIKRMVDELLTLDAKNVDETIKNGHDWAEDHIATSKECIQQVYDFLMNEK
jgi:Asp-tRNA(Asn)/Glu-tRNA(Gln) amidotransferase C subunit